MGLWNIFVVGEDMWLVLTIVAAFAVFFPRKVKR